MVTLTNPYSNDQYVFAGLSTDSKPALSIMKNGDVFIEMDTQKVYFYDAENEEWLDGQSS